MGDGPGKRRARTSRQSSEDEEVSPLAMNSTMANMVRPKPQMGYGVLDMIVGGRSVTKSLPLTVGCPLQYTAEERLPLDQRSGQAQQTVTWPVRQGDLSSAQLTASNDEHIGIDVVRHPGYWQGMDVGQQQIPQGPNSFATGGSRSDILWQSSRFGNSRFDDRFSPSQTLEIGSFGPGSSGIAPFGQSPFGQNPFGAGPFSMGLVQQQEPQNLLPKLIHHDFPIAVRVDGK